MTTSDLPPHVYLVKDRHGKGRYRFRRRGWPAPYLPDAPGSEAFHRAYADILASGPLAKASARSAAKYAPRSLDHLLAEYKFTPRWQKKSDRTRYVQGRILDRFVDNVSKSGKRYGARPVSAVTVAWLDRILGEMKDTPAAANVLRKTLAGLMDQAIKLNWRRDNPARLTDCYAENQEGHHTWTEEEIATYRAKHELGTMARLTLELALNTAARRCNVAQLTRDDIRDGRIVVDHAKGNDETSVPLLTTTKAALEALPAAPIKHLVTTQFGKPFTVPGLGNRMRKWCDEAGLGHCSMHGLRKAMSRRIAESGGTDAEGQAVTGHRKASTFVKYRAKANRTALATEAIAQVAAKFDGDAE